MIKEKWQKLLLREKVLLISGILVILSIPLSLITLASIAISMTFFVVSVFYNLYKFIQMADISITEDVETEIQEGQEELKDGRKVSMKPQFKALTAEQIEDIHSRGKITPAEMAKEWESVDLCAPGDAIGSAAWRCRKFKHCCHDCLVDYANEHDEYPSMFEIMKEVHYKINNNN